MTKTYGKATILYLNQLNIRQVSGKLTPIETK